MDTMTEEQIARRAKHERRKLDREKYLEQNRAYRKKYIEKHPERYAASIRRAYLKLRYGLTVEQWEAMFALQGSVCACCASPESGGKWWHTDHSKQTGLVRGILCQRCNQIAGHLGDNATAAASRFAEIYAYLVRAERPSPERE